MFSIEEPYYFQDGKSSFLRTVGRYIPEHTCHIPGDRYLNAHGQENLESDIQNLAGKPQKADA
jgi:hypothetical protein